MKWLNYHHLFYFYTIAQEGSISKAAQRLSLSHSTLSEQIRIFENTIGQTLFDRSQKKLKINHYGAVIFDYAHKIFSIGEELTQFINRSTDPAAEMLRIGFVNSVSKTVQYEFLKPAIAKPDVLLFAQEGDLEQMVNRLLNQELDILITNVQSSHSWTKSVFLQPLGEIDVWLVGHPKYKDLSKDVKSLQHASVFLPTRQHKMRSDFEAYLHQESISINVRGEIEDFGLLKQFALAGDGLIIAPETSVRKEIEKGELIVVNKLNNLCETLWAMTAHQKLNQPLIAKLIENFAGTYKINHPEADVQ